MQIFLGLKVGEGLDFQIWDLNRAQILSKQMAQTVHLVLLSFVTPAGCSYSWSFISKLSLVSPSMPFRLEEYFIKARRLHRRSLRLPTRRKWAQFGYLGTTAQAGADADIFWS